jgi:small conductance mechanosensitive channel
MQDLSLENVGKIEQHWDKFIDSAVAYAPAFISAIVSAVLILVIGLWIIKILGRFIDKLFEKQKIDISIRRFLGNLINWVLKIMLFIVVVTQLGVQTSTFVAIIGAAGLAIGLALQGSLANFAGGVLILTLKPFKVGDFISTESGVSGTVLIIDIFNTRLNTPQNQIIVIPNGELSNSSITNYNGMVTRRTWFNIGVGYSTDLKQAKEILLNVIKKNELAYDEPAPQVVVTELGDSAVNLSIRVTTSNENFWTMQEQLIINCKEALDTAGIEIPFPQRDVHLINKNS